MREDHVDDGTGVNVHYGVNVLAPRFDVAHLIVHWDVVDVELQLDMIE